MNKDSLQRIEGDTCQRVFPVFEQYRDELLRFVNNQLADHSQSEALVSDVLMKVHRNCEELSAIKNIRAWLYQITRRTLYDYYRERSKSLSLQNEEGSASEFEATDLPPDLSVLIPALINCLPPKYAAPLRLSEIEGIPQKQIAEMLDLSVSGAKSRVQRGRQKLKELFQECLYLELDQRGVPIDYQIKPDCAALKSLSENEVVNTTSAGTDSCDC
ncbi:MAG: sigma-70 family RNA polymerase sigma factor [Cyclobacteriaceae bacterium]